LGIEENRNTETDIAQAARGCGLPHGSKKHRSANHTSGQQQQQQQQRQ
jgi:hypothetical protein